MSSSSSALPDYGDTRSNPFLLGGGRPRNPGSCVHRDIGMGINRKDGRVTVIRALDAMVEMGG